MLSKSIKRTIALALATVTFGLPILTNEAFAAAHNDKVPQRTERKLDHKGEQHKVHSSKSQNNNHKVSHPQNNRGYKHHTARPGSQAPKHKVIHPSNHGQSHRVHHPVNRTSDHRVIHRTNQGSNHRVENRRPVERVRHTPPRPVYRRPAPPPAHRNHRDYGYQHSSHGDLVGGLIIGAILGTIIANNNVDA